jgi:hypothetical protein
METLSRQKVLDIYHAEGTLQQIGQKYNLSPAHVGCIKRGTSHAAVTGAVRAESKRIVLSDETIRRIAEHTGTVRAAAAELGVAESTIKKYRPRQGRAIVRNGRGEFVGSVPEQ